MTIGEIIKTRRNELGLSVDEVAKKIGKDRSTVYRYESNDITKLPATILEPLSKALNITPTVLMGYENDHFAKIPTKTVYAEQTFAYIYIPTNIAVEQLENYDSIQNLPKISMPNIIMGKYAQNSDIVFMQVNDKSMNRVINTGSTIGILTKIKKELLKNGDIVIACSNKGYTIKRYYNITEQKTIVLSPDCDDPNISPILISYDSIDDIKIFGKVILFSAILC